MDEQNTTDDTMQRSEKRRHRQYGLAKLKRDTLRRTIESTENARQDHESDKDGDERDAASARSEWNQIAVSAVIDIC
jgi:hypothetical protein